MNETLDIGNLAPADAAYLIRQGTESDLVACRALDHSFSTQYVWQLAVRDESESPAIRFHQVRLPRALDFENLPPSSLLHRAIQPPQLMLVAEERVGGAARILGYLTMIPEAAQALIRVTHFIVTRTRRGEGIGSNLLDAAEACSRAIAENQAGIQRIRIETQSTNYPAIRYLLRSGFTFSGYDEHYYANGEIAVFFSRMLADPPPAHA